MFWETKKQAKLNENFDQNISQLIEDMADNRVQRGFMLLSGIVIGVSWLIVSLFSNFTAYFYDKLGGFTSKPVIIVLFIPFIAGVVFAYAFFRLKFPEMEDKKMLESDLMASLDYQSHSNKRWLLWIFSILTGLANVAFLIILNSVLNNNGLYLFNF